jgi:murein DD-endopeptidase MepM/ murein hydrolase activator NlpD
LSRVRFISAELYLAHWARLLAAILIAAQVALCAAPVQAAPPQGPTISTTTYIVQPGDTLSLIARRYNTTVRAVAELNGILNPNLIYVGQRLLIPNSGVSTPSPTQIHIVQPGETLTRIASRYETTISAIVAANDLANPSLIFVEQRLVIPGSTPSPPLPSPFIAVELKPLPVIQGQTLAIKIKTDGPVNLAGSLTSTGLSASDNRPLVFVGENGHYWALVGIQANAQVGPYLLELRATDSTGKATETSELVQVAAGDFATEQITLPPEASKLLDAALIRAENERLSQIVGIFSRQQLWEGLFRAPLQGPLRVTSAFGTRRSYSGGPPTSYHEGLDYGAAAGTSVLAAGAGRVALAEDLTVRGKAVIIDHGLGIYSGYYHLSEIAVKAGQKVEQGDLIGKVGSTGLSTGSHLHWEIRVSGVYVDPLQWTRQVFP